MLCPVYVSRKEHYRKSCELGLGFFPSLDPTYSLFSARSRSVHGGGAKDWQITFWKLLFHSPPWASTQLCQADLLVFMKAPASSCCGLVRTVGRLQGSSREWGYPMEEQSGVQWDCSTFLLAIGRRVVAAGRGGFTGISGYASLFPRTVLGKHLFFRLCSRVLF